MTDTLDQKPASTELTGGAGFTHEDTVVAYYLAHLLRHEGAAGLPGNVTSVAVQQNGQGNPMDDLVVEFDDAGVKRNLSLQIKRKVTAALIPIRTSARSSARRRKPRRSRHSREVPTSVAFSSNT